MENFIFANSPIENSFSFVAMYVNKEKYQGLTLLEKLILIKESQDWEYLIKADFNNNAIKKMVYCILGATEEDVQRIEVPTKEVYWTLSCMKDLQWLCNYTGLDLWEHSSLKHFLNK